jgi:hypothetical protein
MKHRPFGEDPMRRTIALGVIALLACSAAAAAQSGTYVDTSEGRFGYALSLPAEFSLEGTVGETTTWTFRPGPTDEAGPKAEAGAPLVIWVNRMPVETGDVRGLYEISRNSDLDAQGRADSSVRDLTDLSLTNAYGYRYREADKTGPNDLHRWIVKLFGNGAVYTVCLSGPFGQFETWGPVFEQVIASFRLIPMNQQ